MNDSIQHIVNKIVQQVHPEAIYLFGSRAKKDFNKDADIDLLVIEKEGFSTTKSRLKELSRIRKAIMPYSTPVDILLFSSDEVNEWKDSINHIIARCLREGKKYMGDQKHAGFMLRMAEDLRALRGMLEDRINLDDEIFGFHAQQCVEKTIKSLLSFLGITYPKIHDLVSLFSLLENNKQKLPAKFLLLIDTTDFAVQFRYESLESTDHEIDRWQLLEDVEDFFQYAQNIIIA